MTTLLDLLNIPRFSNLLLLTEPQQAEIEVKSVDITETPDIAHYIQEGTFVLTTAMVYQDNQQALIPLIDSLKATNAAGLGIKIERFIDKVDPLVIEYANQVQLPIVQIPGTIPLGNLLHQLLNLLWNTKTEQLNYALDIQKQFSDMLVNDVSIEQFIKKFGTVVNTPVILVNAYKKVIASHHFSNATTPAEFYVQQLLSQQLLSEHKRDTSHLIFDGQQETIHVSCYPVEANSYFPHYMIILTPEKISYPVSDFAIDQAKLVLSFILYKNQKVQESLNVLKRDFFTRMIEYQQSSLQKERDWLDLGTNYGLVKARHYRIVYIACKNNEQNQAKIRYKEEEAQVAFEWLKEALYYQIKDMSLFQISHTNHFGLLIQHKLENLEDILFHVSQQLKEATNIELVFGIGTMYESIQHIAKSFIEATDAYNTLCKQPNQQENFFYYQSKGTLSLFEKISSTEVHYFCERTLGDLAYPVDETYIELRKTLKHYLDAQCGIAQSAKDLFVHRNTIKYRIERCSKLLGKNIHEPETNLDIRLALELSEEDLD